MAKKVLLIFIRNPELGKVKTRLAATIGNGNALKVYEELLRYTQQITENLPFRKVLYYADEMLENDRWPNPVYEKRAQISGDLGIKMLRAFTETFASGAGQVVLIGSDCYELTSEILEEAFRQLEKHDAVIGPAADGGYYLAGFSRLNPGVFQNKTWSTATVFQETIQDLKQAGYSYFTLPELNDVDEEKDLGTLRHLLT